MRAFAALYRRLDQSTGTLEKRAAGNPIDLSLLTDGLEAEREQGITIDVAYRYFATPRRKFIIADGPGHVQYTRNMATGASNADALLLLLDLIRRGGPGVAESVDKTIRRADELGELVALYWRNGRKMLPRQMRAAVMLRYYDDMTEPEVAAALGVSVGTVKSTVARAVAKLRKDEELGADSAPGGPGARLDM